MAVAPLPYPAITDPPNVPSDLGKVAVGIENQAVAAYAGYNTTNTPSATSIETRTTAIDAQPGGTAAALDTRITTLNAAINTWTAGTPSNNLSTQVSRTTAFGPRQNSHDSTMTSLNSQLNTYEPQISTLITQRPGGLISSYITSYGLDVTNPTFVMYTTFYAQSSHWYRISFTGTVITTVGNQPQAVLSYWIIAPGSTPQSGGSNAGQTITPLAMTNYAMPFSCAGVINGWSGTCTLTLNAYVTHSGTSQGARLVNFCPYILEDLGYRYY